ncbi:MAG: efflux RND transporter periplasmic adaptor subunit [Burkholderiaceae bacterium]
MMKTSVSISFLISLMLSGGLGHASEPRSRLDCMIQPHQDVQLGSASPGVIAEILVERGEVVQKGQVLARLQASVERAALAVARERAAQVGEVAVAKSSKTLAARELERASELFGQQYVSRTYLDKQRAQAQAAAGRSTQAGENRRLARRQVELARTRLAQRTIRAPFDGVIVEQFMSAGEFVDQKPVMRLASVHPLRVDVLVPARRFGQIRPGMSGTVFPEMLTASSREATVKTVDRVIDAASNTFRVRLELENEDQSVPPGLRCEVDLGLRAEPGHLDGRPDQKAGGGSRAKRHG